MTYIQTRKDTADQIADLLLQVEAIQLNIERPFTWSSGWKSPIYCDNRLSLSYPDARKKITTGLCDIIRESYPAVESIAGVATAGIAQGALIADQLNKPFLYVRPKPKGHGMENLIEGKITKKQKIVVVEDLVSTGGSSLKAVEALQAAGFEVLGMVSIFNYGFETAEQNFAEAKIKLTSLSDYSHMISFALKNGTINEQQAASLKAWRIDPAHWNQ
jgi:orotate phosphoribosyltransferase